MTKVESALSRLDGVKHVSAGWRTDRATVVTEKSATLDLERLNEILGDSGIRAVAVRRVD